jgi:hypothetical protein
MNEFFFPAQSKMVFWELLFLKAQPYFLSKRNRISVYGLVRVLLSCAIAVYACAKAF